MSDCYPPPHIRVLSCKGAGHRLEPSHAEFYRMTLEAKEQRERADIAEAALEHIVECANRGIKVKLIGVYAHDALIRMSVVEPATLKSAASGTVERYRAALETAVAHIEKLWAIESDWGSDPMARSMRHVAQDMSAALAPAASEAGTRTYIPGRHGPPVPPRPPGPPPWDGGS